MKYYAHIYKKKVIVTFKAEVGNLYKNKKNYKYKNCHIC